MRFASLVTASFLVATASFAAGETEISFDDVPAIVMETAIATAPGVDFSVVSTEIENGVTVYEFEAIAFDGKHVEVDVLEDGTLAEVEMEVAMEEVPSEVKDALSNRYPNFAATYIEASTRSDWSLVYEFEGSNGEGEQIAIEIAENGDVIAVSDNQLS